MPEGCLSHRDSGPTKSAARDDERAAEGRSGEAGASGSAAETVRRTVWPSAESASLRKIFVGQGQNSLT